MDKRDVNRVAYATTEASANFRDAGEVRAYRQARMVKWRAAVEFIVRRSPPAPVSVVEVGSGSSALLYALAVRGCLREAVGIEQARTRFEFAEAWKWDDGHAAVRNVHGDFAAVELPVARYDWYVAVDNTFAYLAPQDPDAPRRLFAQAASALRPGGHLLVDVVNFTRHTPGVEYRSWTRFPPPDPVGFGLYADRIEAGVNVGETTWIRRDGVTEEKRELSQVYGADDLRTLFAIHGFEALEVFGGLDESPFSPETSGRIVVVGRKARCAP